MPAPLITGPYESPGALKRFPSPPPGCVVVAERRDGSFEAILPGSRPLFKDAVKLRNYYVINRRSKLYEDSHLARAEDFMVQFRISYEFTLELDHVGGDPKRVGTAALEAVKYFSRNADPAPLFRARIRQRLDRLARKVDTSGTSLLHDAVGELAPNPRLAPHEPLIPASSGTSPLGVTPIEVDFGIRAIIERHQVSPRPRKFDD